MKNIIATIFRVFWLYLRGIFSSNNVKNKQMEDQELYRSAPFLGPDKDNKPDKDDKPGKDEKPDNDPNKPDDKPEPTPDPVDPGKKDKDRGPANDPSLGREDRKAPDRDWLPDPEKIPTEFKELAIWFTRNEGGRVHIPIGQAREMTRLFFKILAVGKGPELTESAKGYLKRVEEKEEAKKRAEAKREAKLTDPQAIPPDETTE